MVQRISCSFTLLVALLLTSTRPASADALTVAWDPNPESSVVGYVLSYGTASGVHPLSINVGNTTTGQVSGLLSGQRYYFVVRAYDALGRTSSPSSEVNGVAVGLSGIVSDVSMPAPTGKSITWAALANGGPLEYRFERYSQATGAWTELRPYSPSNAYTWTPASGDQGIYNLRVWARPVGSALEASRTTGLFTVSNAVSIGSIEADVALPAPVGMPVTFKARAVGGPYPLQYRFVRYSHSTEVWTELQAYSTSDRYTWTTAPGDEGAYVIQVWARGSGSNAPYDGWKSTDTFEIENGPPRVARLTTTTAFPAGTGTPITWEAVAAGGAGPLEYRFLQYSQASGSWTNVQSYGVSSTYTWTPPAGAAGTYLLQVWMRRAGSSVDYEAWGTSGYFQIANIAPTIRSIGSDMADPHGTGVPITWRTDATGGPGPLQYKYLLYNQSRDTWIQLRDYATDSAFTWRPTPGDAGSYSLQVWVRRAGSTAAYDTWAETGFTLSDSTPVVQKVTLDAATVASGTPVTLTALASGGPGELEYLFWRFRHSTGTWEAAQDYSWDKTFAWVPLPGEEGWHTFQVWVRRSGSTATYEAWMDSQVLHVE